MEKKFKAELLKIDQQIFKGKVMAYYTCHLKYFHKACRLTEELSFPPHSAANKKVRQGPDGELLAIGGDLSPERMVMAYKNGIYPMSLQDEPLLWWTSEARCVLCLADLHIRKNTMKCFKKNCCSITADKVYDEVVEACSEPRKGLTWLTPERKEAVFRLHEQGLCHSVEVWKGDELAGGLFLTQIGSYVYFESMFAHLNHASHVAFTATALRLKEMNIPTIDLGIWPTENLKRYGAVVIGWEDYQEVLDKSFKAPNAIKNWGDLFENWDLQASVDKHLTEQAQRNQTG